MTAPRKEMLSDGLFGPRLAMPVLRHNGSTHKPHHSEMAARALEVGKAAEHLVVADLILQGHRAFLTEQGLPYDVVFDHEGRLLRVQVKATRSLKRVPQRASAIYAYQFSVRRAGKGAKRIVGNNEFDLLALVALDIRAVAYLRMTDRVLQTIHLGAPNSGIRHMNKDRMNIDGYTLDLALAELVGPQ